MKNDYKKKKTPKKKATWQIPKENTKLMLNFVGNGSDIPSINPLKTKPLSFLLSNL